MAGDRRGVGDREVLTQVAATQQGEAPRISAIQQKAALAKQDVGVKGKKRKMDIGVKEQLIDKTYEPWIEGSQDVARGSMGDAARMASTIKDEFKPSTTKPPTYAELTKGPRGTHTVGPGTSSTYT